MEDWSRRSDVSLEGIGKGHVLLEPGLLAGWVGKGSLAGPFWPLSTLSASSHASIQSTDPINESNHSTSAFESGQECWAKCWLKLKCWLIRWSRHCAFVSL